MLVLNDLQVIRLLAPARYRKFCIGFLSIAALAALFVLGGGGFLSWAFLLVFGGLGATFLIIGLKAAEPYRPGQSFPLWRQRDAQIARGYDSLVPYGILIAVACFLYMAVEGFSVLATFLLVAGAGTALSGRHLRMVKKVHGNVDAAAVDQAQRIGERAANRIYLAYANFGADDREEQHGNILFLVGADRMIHGLHDNREWHMAEWGFDEIGALGLRLVNAQLAHIVVVHRDGRRIQVLIDPVHIQTTEPRTFVRSFIELIDDWYSGGAQDKALPSARRRIVADVETKPAELVGQARELDFAAPLIKRAASRPLEL
ncbi:hypothetical protein GCM10022280_21920 [Sphingomonas swuensis]|uniref:Uncharacterized protein n=1 Tax=Sphingomonas swuensis TaxID=977800 RepID=A0ABP7T4X3_9SPHN